MRSPQEGDANNGATRKALEIDEQTVAAASDTPVDALDRSSPTTKSERRPKRPPPVVQPIPLPSVLTTSEMIRATRRPLAAQPKVPQNKVGTLEMYKRFPQEYDLLMATHDCSQLNAVFGNLLAEVYRRHCGPDTDTNNLPNTRCSIGLRIADLGCGTGRLLCAALTEASTRNIPISLLVGYDKEAAMLRVALANMQRLRHLGNAPLTKATQELLEPQVNNDARENEDALFSIERAEDWREQIGQSAAQSTTTQVCLRPFDFQHIRQGAFASPHPKLHVAVCAWSLSYVMRSCWGGDRWHQELKDTVDAIIAAVVDGGAVVIIETLGNGCETPTRKNVMMEFLEATYGFERQWIRTDYVFASLQEGEALCRFFFAHGVADAFKQKGVTTLPECTGVWVKHVVRC
jgi:SAM-dependent methyltransferase